MSFTIQQLADRARVPLNDADKDRYTDAELLTYAQDAYLLALRHRPDLFIGQYSALPSYSTLTLVSTFPLSDQYFPIISDYITARAEMKDDEFVNSQRAAQFITLFTNGLGSP
jgi:hypothetical protein